MRDGRDSTPITRKDTTLIKRREVRRVKLDFSADAVTFTCAACLDTLVVERRLTMSAAPVEPTFTIEVDSEHKAKSLNIFSFNHPHHASFHMSWIGFFVSFVSTFAAAPMVAIIREDLEMTKPNLGDAGLAAVTGTIIARVIMGSVCDTVGPRYGLSIVLLLSAPFCFCMSYVTTASGFLICRLGIGLGLATFVACQFWMSCMFNGKCVGIANATAAGWGNLGGGVTQFLMPVIYQGMAVGTEGRIFSAWRWAYLVPGLFHTVAGVAVMFLGQDLPDGNYKLLHTSGQLEKKSAFTTQMLGIKNYRMWCMVATYGFCFGVELTMNNIVAGYLYDQFELDLVTAGILASCYGLMNIFARTIGGLVSDWSSVKYGMRGRLWTLWIFQTVEGVLCVFMALAKNSLSMTILFMVLFSICVQASEGASYGIVPFLTRRALGVASGYIGAGGNAGSTICMALFFKSASIETYDGIMYMGFTIIGVTLLVIPIHFPMWGSMFIPADPSVSEEDYYIKREFSEEEIKEGLAVPVKKFCENSYQERPPHLRPAATAEAKV